MGLPYTIFRLVSYYVRKSVHGYALLKYKKKQKVTGRYMLPPRGVLTAHRIKIKFGRSGDLHNVITHAKFEIN